MNDAQPMMLFMLLSAENKGPEAHQGLLHGKGPAGVTAATTWDDEAPYTDRRGVRSEEGLHLGAKQ